MKSDEVFLRHILDELDFLLKQTGGIDFETFTAGDVLSSGAQGRLKKSVNMRVSRGVNKKRIT